jgi:hypothetical protein
MTDAARAVFIFASKATASDTADPAIAGRRCALLVIVCAESIDLAKPMAKAAMAEHGWELPEIVEIIEVDPKLKLKEFPDLEEPIRSAVADGAAIVAFGPVDERDQTDL